MLGNGRLEALCFDGEKRLAHIRGKLRKKVCVHSPLCLMPHTDTHLLQVWINQGDIILLSLRDYQDEKGDVILKYTADEARSLKAYGELPENAKINETDTYGPFYPSPPPPAHINPSTNLSLNRPRGCRRVQFRVRRRGRYRY